MAGLIDPEVVMTMMTAVFIACVWYFAMSAATYVVYVADKRRAKTDRRRVPEATLHFLELAGGFAGALLAMKIVRHKNRKIGFVLVTCAIAVLHVVVWVGVGWLRWR